MSHPPLAGHDALLDAASDVALYFRAHGSYRGSLRRALAALKGRRPGFHPDQYQRALDSAIILFDTASRLLDEHYARLRSEGPIPGPGPEAVVPPLAQRCPGFPESTYIDLLNWLDLYYYQM
jgi:hypothetical protein